MSPSHPELVILAAVIGLGAGAALAIAIAMVRRPIGFDGRPTRSARRRPRSSVAPRRP